MSPRQRERAKKTNLSQTKKSARKGMIYRSVLSSTLVAVGYDAPSRTLGVIFKSGGAYSYAGVPAEVHAALVAESRRVARGAYGASVGGMFHATVRDKYPYSTTKAPVSSAVPAPVSDLSKICAKLLRERPTDQNHKLWDELNETLMTLVGSTTTGTALAAYPRRQQSPAPEQKTAPVEDFDDVLERTMRGV